MKNIILSLIKIYKSFLSESIKVLFGGGCRFQPTCSEYALEAIDKRGVWGGTILTVRRLSKCHPLGSSGYDPVK